MATPSATEKEQGDIMFGPFRIPSASIFYRSPQNSFAFVNLRPIVKGHVLVVPEKVVPHLADLDETSHTDLWNTVRVVQRILQETYPETTAFNVAVQDGRSAGQSVAHVHVHILPRTKGDYEHNDDIYNDIQDWAPRDEMRSSVSIEVLPDEERTDRTTQQMADEAALYRTAEVKLSLS